MPLCQPASMPASLCNLTHTHGKTRNRGRSISGVFQEASWRCLTTRCTVMRAGVRPARYSYCIGRLVHHRDMKVWIARGCTVIGVLFTLLGTLWFLQGADLIHLKPVACVANCTPIEGGSITWLLVGLATAALGLIVTIRCNSYLKRMRDVRRAQV